MRPVNWTLKSIALSFLSLLVSCSEAPKPSLEDVFDIQIEQAPEFKEGLLPIMGNTEINNGDTTWHTIAPFAFQNQNGQLVGDSLYQGKVYIADFFFTTCPGICPIMTKQLTRVQQALPADQVELLSFTVNPEFDTDSVLLAYANRMNADLRNWNFLTGEKDKIYQLAATSFLVVANFDPNEEIPFVHSDRLVLIDKKGRIRGQYVGTDSLEVDQLIKDTKWLIQH